MIKVAIDKSQLNSELSRLLDESVAVRDAKTDNDRRNKASILVEKIRTLKARVSDDTLLENK